MSQASHCVSVTSQGSPDSRQEIELIHSRLSSLSLLGLPRFRRLKKLCLRQNYIADLDSDSLAPLTELEELDLYDNRLKHIGDALDTLGNLGLVPVSSPSQVFQVLISFRFLTISVLDLSFNNLKHVPHCLPNLTSLHTIYFVQNKISHIAGLEGVGRTLRSLELGVNRIRVRFSEIAAHPL